MSTSFLAVLTAGEPAYKVRTSWPPVLAVLAGVSMFLLAVAGGWLLCQAVWSIFGLAGGPEPGAAQAGGLVKIGLFELVSMLVMQFVLVSLILAAATLYGNKAEEALALNPPQKGSSVFAPAIALMMVFLVAYTGLVYVFRPDDFLSDVAPFADVMRSPNWWVLWPVAVLGAPLSEELLFRGFLFPALANTALGVRGAATATAGSWALLHGNYSMAGLVEVFIVGLMLTWLLWRTGSLWVPIVCHASYNFAALLLLTIWPSPAGSAAAVTGFH